MRWKFQSRSWNARTTKPPFHSPRNFRTSENQTKNRWGDTIKRRKARSDQIHDKHSPLVWKIGRTKPRKWKEALNWLRRRTPKKLNSNAHWITENYKQYCDNFFDSSRINCVQDLCSRARTRKDPSDKSTFQPLWYPSTPSTLQLSFLLLFSVQRTFL